MILDVFVDRRLILFDKLSAGKKDAILFRRQSDILLGTKIFQDRLIKAIQIVVVESKKSHAEDLFIVDVMRETKM